MSMKLVALERSTAVPKPDIIKQQMIRIGFIDTRWKEAKNDLGEYIKKVSIQVCSLAPLVFIIVLHRFPMFAINMKQRNSSKLLLRKHKRKFPRGESTCYCTYM